MVATQKNMMVLLGQLHPTGLNTARRALAGAGTTNSSV
jgi:hypothetical protein